MVDTVFGHLSWSGDVIRVVKPPLIRVVKPPFFAPG